MSGLARQAIVDPQRREASLSPTVNAVRQKWSSGTAPVAVVMLSLNEAHNMEGVLRNLRGWAQEVFLVDSYSTDGTVDIALRHGVHVVQRPFSRFGDQWNFALRELPIKAPWTMKVDPDERLSEELKRQIALATTEDNADVLTVDLRLYFMAQPLPVRHRITRAWRSGNCRFSQVLVNEHPVVTGRERHLSADLEHYDSPDLGHWLEKQNSYTTAEAVTAYQRLALSAEPKLFGTPVQRRMWIKRHYRSFPFRYTGIFLYHYLVLGAWRAGWVGYAWSRLRTDVCRLIEYKLREIQITGRLPLNLPRTLRANADPRVRQYE